MRRHLYAYTYLLRPFSEASDVLAGDPSFWLPQPAQRQVEGWQVQLDAAPVVPGRLGQQLALVTVSPGVVTVGGSMLRALRWRSLEEEGRFPVLDADLELVAVSDESCQLSLLGWYRPPLSMAGALGDLAFGNRAAGAVAHAFVLDVSDRLSVPQPVMKAPRRPA